MARKLNKRQLKLLEPYTDCTDYDELPINIQDQLESINDYETMIHDVNRALNDQHWAKRAATSDY